MSLAKKINTQKSFKDWILEVKKNKKVSIKKINYISCIKRKKGDFSLSTIDTEITYNDKTYQRAVQLEGKSVVIIPVIKQKNKLKTLLVSQFRAPKASLNLEFPSGKAEHYSLKKSAQLEIKEEIGLEVSQSILKPLNKKPIYMLPANNFSQVYYFYFIKKVQNDFFNKFKNKTFGKTDEGEHIKLKFVDFSDLLNITNSASVIIGYALLKKNEIL